GWVQGTAKSGQSLGVRVLAPASWTATTGTQTAQQMSQFDPDGQVSWVQVRPASATASAQFLNALVPVAAAQWASRTPVAPLDAPTLAVTGNRVRDFRAYAPGASAVTVNGVPVSATFEGGLVTYPAVVAPPPADGGSADAGAPDSGDPGNLCGNCQPPSDGGPNPALDAGTLPPEPALPVPAAHGCSHTGTAA